MVQVVWENVLSPAFVAALATLIASLTAFIAALRAKDSADKAVGTVSATHAVTQDTNQKVSTIANGQADMIALLLERLQSLEGSYRQLAALAQQRRSTDGPPPPQSTPGPPDSTGH